ncbi:fumarylacetoacetate hydrolase [Penicillium angulare]|uniref:Fumarylacetoacetate hydrolase n=1 Tax=Penicillium angulare TaxID=116970 RepID=A0A9W9KKQ0_9EURO|nr:fumarylacetoacetate hydrolase [Penicillium angulare]
MSKPIHYGRTKDDWGSPLSSRKLCPHEDVKFDPKLKPRAHPMAGERIHSVGSVPNFETIRKDPGVTIIHGKGRTLMSGLGDAHTHLSWNDAALGIALMLAATEGKLTWNIIETLGEVGVEEHTIITARSAMTYIDSGYTMCYGAASAKERLDCVIRNAINQGSIPGPRYLANGKEIARRGGELTPAITTFADGENEMVDLMTSL